MPTPDLLRTRKHVVAVIHGIGSQRPMANSSKQV